MVAGAAARRYPEVTIGRATAPPRSSGARVIAIEVLIRCDRALVTHLAIARGTMKLSKGLRIVTFVGAAVIGAIILVARLTLAEQPVSQKVAPRGETSYMPVAQTESFTKVMARMKREKPGIEKRHQDLLMA